MYSKELLLITCLVLLGGLRLTSTTTTTTFVAAMSIANQDLDRYFRSANVTHTLAAMAEDRIMLESYTYAHINCSFMVDPDMKELVYDKEQARYGEGRILNVTGKLVHITDASDEKDNTACSSRILGTGGRPIPAAGVPWIALVKRGSCTFEEKVKNVYEKGAAGVIVYNDKPVMNLDKMQIKGQERKITAVITYEHIGLEMARYADEGYDIDASIRVGRSGQRPINSLNRTSVLFVSISFIVLMVISLIWLVFYYIQRFRYLHNKDQQSRHLCSVTKKAIMKIPTKTGKSSDEKDMDSDCCAICIEAYKSSDCIRVLPCKHEFHKNCIDPWLIEHRTCPMCKLDVLKFYGFVFLGSEESILDIEAAAPASASSAVPTLALAGNTATTTTQMNERLHRLSPTGGGALGEMIRSRDFVLDFPRLFVLEPRSAAVTQDTLFPARLSERSQSSLSLAQAKDWMTTMSNRLDEQHGLRRLCKSSVRDDMEEHLLNVRSDSLKRRRSHSADGRFSLGFLERKDARQQTADDGAVGGIGAGNRSGDAMRGLTDASYAQSKQRRKEELDTAIARRRALQGGDFLQLEGFGQRGVNVKRADSPPTDLNITIQLNGEGLNLE